MTFILTSALYLAAAIFLAGMARSALKWLRTPAPLKIVLTPAPPRRSGVVRRVLGEILGFRSLFEAGHFFWLQSWVFHVSLLLLLAGHIAGLVAPEFSRAMLGMGEKQFHRLALLCGGAFGLLALASLYGLLFRRLMQERPRWISTFGDYFVLTLLLFIVFTGNQMRFMNQFDLDQARRFVSGWLTFHPASPPASTLFTTHVLLVSALLVYIPFSKLVHICAAAAFNPTLNQLDHSRESATA